MVLTLATDLSKSRCVLDNCFFNRCTSYAGDTLANIVGDNPIIRLLGVLGNGGALSNVLLKLRHERILLLCSYGLSFAASTADQTHSSHKTTCQTRIPPWVDNTLFVRNCQLYVIGRVCLPIVLFGSVLARLSEDIAAVTCAILPF